MGSKGDCQFEAVLPSLRLMSTIVSNHVVEDVAGLRILVADFLLSHGDDPCSYCSATDTHSTWSADILASVQRLTFWKRYHDLDFETYCSALMIPGSKLFACADCI